MVHDEVGWGRTKQHTGGTGLAAKFLALIHECPGISLAPILRQNEEVIEQPYPPHPQGRKQGIQLYKSNNAVAVDGDKDLGIPLIEPLEQETSASPQIAGLLVRNPVLIKKLSQALQVIQCRFYYKIHSGFLLNRIFTSLFIRHDTIFISNQVHVFILVKFNDTFLLHGYNFVGCDKGIGIITQVLVEGHPEFLHQA